MQTADAVMCGWWMHPLADTYSFSLLIKNFILDNCQKILEINLNVVTRFYGIAVAQSF